MGVNLVAAKKMSRMGKMGNSAKKAKTPPKVSAPLPSCIRRTKIQSTAKVATKKSRLQIDPNTWAKTLPQRKKERIIGHPERRRTVGFVGLRNAEGSILTWISPFRRYATLVKFGPKRSSPSQRAIPPKTRRPSFFSIATSLATVLPLLGKDQAIKISTLRLRLRLSVLQHGGCAALSARARAHASSRAEMLNQAQAATLAFELPIRQKPRGDAAPSELLVLEHGEVQREGRLHTRDGELIKGPKSAAYGGLAVTGVHDELRQEGVVVRGHHVAGVEVRVDPDTRPAWRIIDLYEPGLGQEVAAGVLGVDPELDRVPVGREGILRYLQPLARDHLQLFGHDVDA